MKNLQTGETDGPPLEHDEWTERQRKLEAEEVAKIAARNAPKSKPADDDTKSPAPKGSKHN